MPCELSSNIAVSEIAVCDLPLNEKHLHFLPVSLSLSLSLSFMRHVAGEPEFGITSRES